MKIRTIGTALGLSSFMVCAGWAQSTFQLRNQDLAHGIDAPVRDAAGTLLAGTGYLVELWGAATPDSLSPAIEFYANQRLIIPFRMDRPGYFLAPVATLAIPSVPMGGFAWLQVRAWDARLGSTYEDAMARGLGGYGESAPFYAVGGNPGALVPPQPLIGLQSFSLRPAVPEPSVWLLLALGVGGLAWGVRRNKASFPRQE